MGCLTGGWYFKNKVTGEKVAWYCKSGRCVRPECRECFCNKRIYTICNLITNYKLNKFFTLTLDRSLTLEQAWEEIPKLWSKMRRRLGRYGDETNQEFVFVAVLEQHKDGYPHIHGFTSMYMPKELWSKHWREVGGGKNGSRIEGIKDLTNVGEYVTKELVAAKYVGKDNVLGALAHIEKGRRTFWRSKGLKTQRELEKKPVSDWELVKGIEYGEVEQTREDLERAQYALPEESVATGKQELEACKTATIGSEEVERVEGKAGFDQLRDQAHSWLVNFCNNVKARLRVDEFLGWKYGKTTTRYAEYP